MKLFKDVNGKTSSKRLGAWFLLILGAFMGIMSGFELFDYSETLILGILGIAGGVLFGTTFEKTRIGDNPPEEDEEDTPG